MNSFDQYITVMQYLKSIDVSIPIFYEDEAITGVSDYIVLGGSNVDLSHKDCQTNLHSVLNIYKVRIYSRFRGKSMNVASLYAEKVCGSSVDRLSVECKGISTTKLERDLFESTLTLFVDDEVLY